MTVGDNSISGNENNLDYTENVALDIVDSGSCNIYGNSIDDNAGYGLEFYGCNNSVVYNNNIMGDQVGIDLKNYTGSEPWLNIGSGNEVFNNNLVGNSQDVAVGARSDNVSWDDGYVGNYWSDYQTKYPNASETDNLGTSEWNTSYAIYPNNADNYPLVNQVNISAPVPTPTPAPTPTPTPTSSPTPTPTPILTPLPSIPEFPTWVALAALLIMSTLAAVAVKRRFRSS